MAEADALHRRRWEAAEARTATVKAGLKPASKTAGKNASASAGDETDPTQSLAHGEEPNPGHGSQNQQLHQHQQHPTRYGYATTEAEILDA